MGLEDSFFHVPKANLKVMEIMVALKTFLKGQVRKVSNPEHILVMVPRVWRRERLI